MVWGKVVPLGVVSLPVFQWQLLPHSSAAFSKWWESRIFQSHVILVPCLKLLSSFLFCYLKTDISVFMLKITDKNYVRFLSNWKKENKPHVLLFDHMPLVPLLYKVKCLFFGIFLADIVIWGKHLSLGLVTAALGVGKMFQSTFVGLSHFWEGP